MKWQIKVTTYDEKVEEVEIFQADSKEEIEAIREEMLKNQSENELISEPFPVS